MMMDETMDNDQQNVTQLKTNESNYDLGQNLHKQTVSQPHFKLKLRPGQEYQIKARESVINSFRSSITSSIDQVHIDPNLQLDCLSEENIEVVPPPGGSASLLFQFYNKLT